MEGQGEEGTTVGLPWQRGGGPRPGKPHRGQLIIIRGEMLNGDALAVTKASARQYEKKDTQFSEDYGQLGS